MSDPVYQPMPFPSKGLHVSAEVAMQPDGTTPVGANVRLVNPGSLRARGGSRSGLSRFIDDRTSANEVQDLGTVVTASSDALLGASVAPDGGYDPYGTEGPDWIEDPSTNNKAPPGAGDPDDPRFNPLDPDVRNPGRRLPPEGSGEQPSPDGGVPPIARADAARCDPGGGSVTVEVLENDSYLGTPTISISSGPLFAGATAEVVGEGADSKIVYTSRPEPDYYDDMIGYRLFGSKNTSLAANILRVSVRSADGGGGGEPGVFTLLSGVVQEDGQTVRLTFSHSIAGLAAGDLLGGFTNSTKGSSKFSIANAGGETGNTATFDTGSGWVFSGDVVKATVDNFLAGEPVAPAPATVTLTNNSTL